MSEQVPEGWSSCTVGDVSSVKRGASPRPIKDPKWWGGNTGWIRISDVTASKKYLYKTSDYLSDEGVAKSVKIQQGEVILSICATIGRPMIVRTDACIHDGFVWFDNLKSQIDREFFYYFLAEKEGYLSSQRQTGTQGNLNTGIVSELNFPLPPKPEQQKIASILTSVDDTIEKTESQISKLQDLKKGMMQELLTKGIGHTEFKDSPVGRIPVGWEITELDQLADAPICYGVVQVGKFVEDGVPVMAIKNLGVSFKDNINRTSKEIEGKYKRSRIRGGDVLISVKGTIGRVDIVPVYFQGNISRDIVKIRPSSDIYGLFLKHFFQSTQGIKSIEHTAVGTTRAELSVHRLKKMQIPVPSYSEQKEISHIIESIDRNISTTNQRLCANKIIKKALMQDLLSGKVRVKAD